MIKKISIYEFPRQKKKLKFKTEFQEEIQAPEIERKTQLIQDLFVSLA